jgi:hypothetical protein
MSDGRHAANFTVVRCARGLYLLALVGLSRPGIDATESSAQERDEFWGIGEQDGGVLHGGGNEGWEGHEGFEDGDVVGLLLDCDAGTLAVKKNGKRLGVAATGLTGKFC